LIKATAQTNDYTIESTILNKESVAETYVNTQSNNIILPEISPDNKIIRLTNAHCNLFDKTVKLQIFDVYGKKKYETNLNKDSMSYRIPSLKENTSYICTMTIEGKAVRQAILFGNFDNTYMKFVALRNQLSNSHPRANEIDQILYRLKFLLNHETRKSDWWWQFKIAPLTYQLELIFANLNGKHSSDKNEFNIQFVTYNSKLDGGIQRYLLATPNKILKGKKYSLVIVIRPHVDNHHHFFTSPQLTHQWAINILQSLANSHNFIVMMPEARMYHNENITPFIEAEIKLAIEDVKQRYNLDENKIYLHGICSGGYRALRMATENPGMFAALGLYTPMYHESYKSDYTRKHSLENMLPKLSGTSIMLFADPFDKHTPYFIYSDLIEDCKKNGIPLEFSQKINTELLYNTLVVGEEAFDFFDGKIKSNFRSAEEKLDTENVIFEMYSKPFIYVYNSCDQSDYYRKWVARTKKDYEKYFFSKLPIVADKDVDERLMKTKNIFFIGDHFENPIINNCINKIKKQSPELFTVGTNCISIHPSPIDSKKKIVIYNSYSGDPSYFKYPWIDGIREYFKSNEK
jgi:hypothetical protein